MGWSTGTDIFDTVAEHLLDAEADLNVTERVLEHLYDIMKGRFDWDTQDESEYWEHPMIGPILGNDKITKINLEDQAEPKLDVSLLAAEPGRHMDLRDYFAAAALTGLLTGADYDDDSACSCAYIFADEMIMERKKARNEEPGQ